MKLACLYCDSEKNLKQTCTTNKGEKDQWDSMSSMHGCLIPCPQQWMKTSESQTALIATRALRGPFLTHLQSSSRVVFGCECVVFVFTRRCSRCPELPLQRSCFSRSTQDGEIWREGSEEMSRDVSSGFGLHLVDFVKFTRCCCKLKSCKM